MEHWGWCEAIFRMQSPVCVLLLPYLIGEQVAIFFLQIVRHIDTPSCRVIVIGNYLCPFPAAQDQTAQ